MMGYSTLAIRFMEHQRFVSTAVVFIYLLIIANCQELGSRILDGSTVSGNTSLLTEDGVRVEVLGSITLKETDTLIIEEGITLSFQAETWLHVLGRIEIKGTDTNPVVFKGDQDGAVWQGMQISSSNSKGNVVRHLQIEDAEIGIWVTAGASLIGDGIHVKSPQVSGLQFEDTKDVRLMDITVTSVPQDSCGICVTGGRNFEVNGCEIDRGAGQANGISAKHVKNVVIKNCKISSGTSLGLDLNDVFGNITLESSTFSTNVGGSRIRTDPNESAFVLVEKIRATSVGFSGHCLTVESLGDATGTVTVRNSVIYGCSKALYIRTGNKSSNIENNQLYLSRQALDVHLLHTDAVSMIRGNVFSYNSNQDRDPIVNVAIKPEGFQGDIQVSGNLFQQNKCRFVFRILSLKPSSPTMRLEIVYNQFHKNAMDWQMTGDKAVVMLKLASLSDNFLFQNNSLINPASRYDLAVGGTSFDYGYVLDASKNFWDFSRKSVLQIEERVLAHHLERTRARVILEPFVLSFEPYILSSLCEDTVCDCPEGYGGPYCQESNCLKVNNCTGHGDCIGANQCQCFPKWQGEACNIPVCSVGCINGDCVAPDICNYSDSWRGESCDEAVCPYNCSNRGVCNEPGICTCDQGWTGDSCDIPHCLERNNCTGQGDCIEPNLCSCYLFWTGENCSLPSCSGLKHCSGNGVCVSPGRCECNTEWMGSACDVANCSTVLKCSNHGKCVAPNVCECYEGFTDANCSRCSDGYWGRDCLPCPNCQKGSCHEEGYCSCESPNWTGLLCDRCSESFYGSDCQPLPLIKEIIPDSGPVEGGTVVTIVGDNLPNNTYSCSFGDMDILGLSLEDASIQCLAPPNLEGPVNVGLHNENISIDNNVNFTYYDKCVENSCGENNVPPRGVCVLGTCVCNAPWSEENCLVLQQAPDIAKLSGLTVWEYQNLSVQLQLHQGTMPVRWSLNPPISGVQINPNTGLLVWSNLQLLSSMAEITVSAHNIMGSDNETIQISIQPSYKVVVLEVIPSGPFLKPIPVTLKGEITSRLSENQSLSTPVPVEIRIQHGDLIRTIKTEADVESMSFEEIFYPLPTDRGVFKADACHPSVTDFSEQVSWEVLGMEITPNSIHLKGPVRDKISREITLNNLGVNPITNLQYSVMDADEIDIKMAAHGRRDVTPGETLLTELHPSEPVFFNVTIQAQEPGNTSKVLTVFSAEGVNISIELHITAIDLGPVLEMSPKEINITVQRGRERTLEIKVTNVGSSRAYNLEAKQIETSDLVTVLAFDILNPIRLDYQFIDLDPDQSAMMILLVAPPSGLDVGPHRESIQVQSENTMSTLWVNVDILSGVILNLTVVVKDENGCLNGNGLSSASVRLFNKALDLEVEMETDSEGVAVISDIPEAQYDLTIDASNHVPKSQVIFVTPDTAKVEVFLQSVAVNLSWVQTDDEGTYPTIGLAADITRDAPYPVLTVEPNTIDLGSLELGLQDVIDLQIQNQGSATAENVEILLPSSHPFLQFNMITSSLGELGVNETVQVAIGVEKHNPEAGKNSKMTNDSHLLIKVRYSHTCVETVTREVDVILLRIGNKTDDFETSVPDLDYSIPFVQSLFCDSCVTTVADCVSPITVPDSWKDCAAFIFGRLGEDEKSHASVLGRFLIVLELFFTCGTLKTVVEDEEDYSCLAKTERDCKDKMLNTVDLSRDAPRQTIAPAVAHRRLVIQSLVKAYRLIIPESWSETSSALWYRDVASHVLSINGDAGLLITEDELSRMLTSRIPSGLSAIDIESFMSTVNATLYNWQIGNVIQQNESLSYSEISSALNPFFDGLHEMIQNGFSEPVTWFSEGLKKFRMASQGEDLCAKASIRLSKKLVQVDESLTITLEIKNGLVSSLLDLRLNLNIVCKEDGENCNHLFDIDGSMMVGFENDSQSLVLPLGSSGSQTWSVVPRSNSSHSGSVRYQVTTDIQHRLRGETLRVPISGELFTVTALPRMAIRVFYPRFPSERLLTQGKNQTRSLTVSLVVQNIGTVTIKYLKIKSARLSILETSTGKVQQCRIKRAMLNKSPITSAFELHLGDIQSQRIVRFSWNLECQKSARIEDISFSFTRKNAQGDTVLFNPEFDEFYEVLHEVRLYCLKNDQQQDLLVFTKSKNMSAPDTVFSSEDEISKFQVSTTDEYEVHEVLNDGVKTELQILVQSNTEGWHWVQIPFTFPKEQELKKVRRHDGINIILQRNIWLTFGSDGGTVINLFDWFSSPTWEYRRKRQAMTFNSYFMELGIRNDPPTFPQEKFQTSVSENANLFSTVLRCPAFDVSDDVTYYEVTGEEQYNPFGVNEYGDIVVIGALDRESKPVYRLVLTAYDNGEPPMSASTAIGITVLDENDNSPEFEEPNYSILIQDIISLNSPILTVSARDKDVGENGTVLYSLSSQEELPFSIDTKTGVLTTSGSLLNHSYSFEITAANPNGTNRVSVPAVVNVILLQEFTQIFTEHLIQTSVEENQPTNVPLAYLFSPDEVPSGIEFEILSIVPFSINYSSGYLQTNEALDRETRSSYNFTLRARDNTPTDQLKAHEEAAVLVNVIDVNDNTPAAKFPEVKLSVKEDILVGSTIHSVSFTDRDEGVNSVIADFNLTSHDNNTLGVFAYNVNENVIDIHIKSQLNREETSHYTLTILAADGGSPSLSGTVTLLINILDVNDNPPMFESDALNVNVSKLLPVNSKIFVAKIMDLDSNGFVSFSLRSSVNLFRINPDSGVVTLWKPLKGRTVLAYDLTIIANDGIFETSINLTVTLSQKNDHAPKFDMDVYTVELEETVQPGTFVEILFAEDADGEWVTYSLEDGDPYEIFYVDGVSGEITLQYPLDEFDIRNFTLTVSARDGELGIPTTRIGYATVRIIVIRVNNFPPTFESGKTCDLEIVENSPYLTIMPIKPATDEDGDGIVYSLLDDTSDFSVDSTNGNIYVQCKLDRETRSTYMLRLLATDDGSPPRSSTLDVQVHVLDVNDNPPSITSPESHIKIPQKVIRPHVPIYQIMATDPDEGNNSRLSYHLHSNSSLLSIDVGSGAIFCARECQDIQQGISVESMIVVSDNGTPKQQTNKTCIFEVIVPGPPVSSSQFVPNKMTHSTDIALAVDPSISKTTDSDSSSMLMSPEIALESTDDFPWSSVHFTSSMELSPSFSSIFQSIPKSYDLQTSDIYSPSHESLPTAALPSTRWSSEISSIQTSPSLLFSTVVSPSSLSGHITSTLMSGINTYPFDSDGVISTQMTDGFKPYLGSEYDDIYTNVAESDPTLFNYETDVVPTSLQRYLSYHSHDVKSTLPYHSHDVKSTLSYHSHDVKSTLPYHSHDVKSTLYYHIHDVKSTPMSGAIYSSAGFDGEVSKTDEDILHTDDNVGLEVNGRDDEDNEFYDFVIFDDNDGEGHGDDHTDKHDEDSDNDEVAKKPEDSDDPGQDADSTVPSTPTTSSSSTAITSPAPKPLPTAALEPEQYKVICNKPIDAIVTDRAGVFIFQDNNVWRLSNRGRSIVRGYPKTISRVFSGWWRKKVKGPITAAVYSEESDLAYLFKGTTAWIFQSRRLVGVVPVGGLDESLEVGASVVIPDKGIYLIQGDKAYKLIEEEEDLQVQDPIPLEEIVPGSPSPLEAAFTNKDRTVISMFSKQLVYEWSMETGLISENSPQHITEWMDCIDY